MQFTVTYRGANGAMVTEAVEAANRADCFAQMKKRGIAPTSVKEGGSRNGRGASAAKRPSAAPARKKSNSIAEKILLVVVLLAAIGGGLWWWFSQEELQPTTDPEVPKKSGLAKEVTPSAAPTNKVVEVAKPKPKEKRLKKWEYPVERTNELSAAELRKWKVMHRPPPGYTNDTSRTEPPPKYAIFKHHSENEIASLLTMTPGETLVGTPHYTKKLTDDFLKSLETPIVVTEEDSPEDAELKRAMIQTKIELKERLDAGEDLGQILLDTRSQYQDLARYKMTLEGELSELRKNPDVTMQDIDDFMAAANQLLEQKGIAPIKLSPISKRMLMRKKGKK